VPSLTSQLHFEKISAAFRGGTYSAHDIWFITYPVIIDTIFTTIVDFVNTGIISSNGPASISAVNTVNSIHWVLVGVLTSIELGITVLISQNFGAGRKEKIGIIGASGIHTNFFVSIVASSIVLIFEDSIIGALFGSADADVSAGIHIFLFGILVSYPLRSIYLCAEGILRGIARTKVTLVLSFIANGSNVALNIVFVTFLGWGMQGLCTAVIVSQTIGAIAGVILLTVYRSELRFRWKLLLTIRFAMIRRVLTVSFPFILENFFFNGGKLIIQIFIVPFGTMQIAANGIVGSWNHFAEIIPASLATAIVPIVGSSVGSKNYAYARKITKTFIILGSVISAVSCIILIALYPWAMTSFFHAPEQIHGILWKLFLLNAAAYPVFFSAQAMLPATLRAAGDGAYTTKATLASMWIYRIGVGYLVSVVLGFQIVGLWAVWVTEWGVRAFILWLRYRGTKWEQHRLA
jgi:putative MATE family efflux protein